MTASTINPERLAHARPRLEKEDNIWLASVRKDGRPHLVPVWFVWYADRIWFVTEAKTQKIANIQANPKVSVALEDGVKPVILEGSAELDNSPDDLEAIAAKFQQKYSWSIQKDLARNSVLVRITPKRLLSW
ncbi:MAG: pyridoxamine 5'-phosphate oxidase [Chloroflexi bacterium]|nr:pyridoxamine 5'-phosphate oxidase [Chloroflexota bacterium]